MYAPRYIQASPTWTDEDGAKVYTISLTATAVDHAPFRARAAVVKSARRLAWNATPHFVIFHQGVRPYLIVAWWGETNELFTSVSVRADEAWEEDPARNSFCVHDLEVFWFERSAFIQFIHCNTPDAAAYRNAFRADWLPAAAAQTGALQATPAD